MHGITVQVKLLMEIPEKIWTCIEAEDFVKATQLLIMARHVNTGTKIHNKFMMANIFKSFLL